MFVDLICIGNELLLGKIQELNAHFLAKELLKHRLKLRQVHVIADDEKILHETLDMAYRHSPVVITTGGLGPTEDDYTKKFVANYFQKKIVDSPEALQVTKTNYERYGREFHHGHNHYHYIPKGFKVHHNQSGFAPGLSYFDGNRAIYCAPGVPREFQSLMTNEFLHTINRDFQLDEISQEIVTVKTFGIPEQKIFSELCPNLWQKLESYGTASSLPHVGGVDIGVVLSGEKSENLKKKERIINHIQQSVLGNSIWHIGQESLEEVIINESAAKGLTFGFAESCSGGLNAHRITKVSGSSKVFMGSVVSYSNAAKMKLLDVNPETVERYGAVSVQTAQEMAYGAREQLECDIVTSTSGIAGPTGGTKEKPVGTVAIGYSHQGESKAKLFQLRGDRDRLTLMFSQMALMRLLKLIRRA